MDNVYCYRPVVGESLKRVEVACKKTRNLMTSFTPLTTSLRNCSRSSRATQPSRSTNTSGRSSSWSLCRDGESLFILPALQLAPPPPVGGLAPGYYAEMENLCLFLQLHSRPAPPPPVGGLAPGPGYYAEKENL
ncbi:uncharacterized protein LOC135155624 [Lytechinus pictus]|uniref:uncharacterized protein LOC135155624 n=1 Tax=Lytechinus pictus TaxID=7653 RepID=UPI0030B9E4D1